jgi:hypothetical protein
MEDLAARFREGVKERGGFRYPKELRELAVEYARQGRGRGAPWRRIGEELGLCKATLERWVERGKEPSASVGHSALHEVGVVVEPSVASRPVLVMPCGARVEGLTMGDLVSVLEALR